jgi:hypothetical protein
MSAAAPAADGNTVYVLYLPDGVVFVDAGNVPNTDCGSLEGAHFQYHVGNDNWAFVQRCLHNDQAGIDDATNTASHEIFEAATDPVDAFTLPQP